MQNPVFYALAWKYQDNVFHNFSIQDDDMEFPSTDRYGQLKKNLKHFSEIYSTGILTGTLDAARIAIIDLQEEVQELKNSLRKEIGMKDITGREIRDGDTLVYGDNLPQTVRWNESCQTWGMGFETGATTNIPVGCRIVDKEG